MNCPELDTLQGRSWTAETRAHVAECGTCKLVMELIDERSQAAASRERRAECARFEALIAVRVGAELQGAARAMLEEHLRECTDCRALANTMAPVDDAQADHAALPAIDPAAYALGSEVARGGMGRIIAARDLRIGRPVAVKELLAKNAGLAARFEREARVTARLQHPGIVPIYEIGRWESGTPFYAMRMVEGKTLRAALQERTTPAARLALLPSVIAAAEAVAFAHAHQVIHRDLTPSNILVGEYGETVVIDWGLAKDLSEATDDADAGPYRRDPTASADLTAAGAVIGTAAYMPPEQAAGERVDARADVYAIGALLYHLLAGSAPYKGTLEEVLRAVKSEPPKPLPESTPRDLTSIVTKAMARDPSKRYASAKELAAELTAFQAGRLVGAHEYTRGELLRRFVRRNRGVLAAAAIALIVLGALGTVAVRRVLVERDDANEQRALAEQRQGESQTLSTTLLVEQGRQELLIGKHERAAALLAEAYKAAPDDKVIRQLLGFAMRRLEVVERLQQPRLPGRVDFDGARIEASADGARYVVRLGNRLWLSEARPDAPILVLDEQDPGDWPHFTPDGRLVIAVGRSAVRVWDLAGKLKHEIRLERKPSWAGVSRDGATLIAITVDGAWGAWNLDTGKREQFVESGVKGTNAWPGATPASSVVDEILPIVTSNGNVVVWDWRRALIVARFSHGAGYATPFATAYDGKTLVTCGQDGLIKRWDARKGQLLSTIVEPSGGLATCALSSNRVASSSLRGTTRVWSPEGVATVSIEGAPALIRFSVDGARILLQGLTRSVSIRDAATGTLVAEFGPSGIASATRDHAFLVRPDGAVDRVQLTFGLLSQLPSGIRWRFHEREPEGRAQIVEAPDGSLTIRDQTTGSRPLPIVAPFALSADGMRIVGWNGRGLSLLRATGELEREISLAVPPYRIGISNDGRRIAGRFAANRLIVWDATTGAKLGEIADDSNATIGFDVLHRVTIVNFPAAFRLWDPPAEPVLISRNTWQWDQVEDGSLIAVTTGDRVEVVDTKTSQRVLTIPEVMFAVFDQPVSRGGTGSLFLRGNGEVTQWNTKTWKRIGRFPLPADYSRIAASPDGSVIATSAGIWETRGGRQLAVFDRGAPKMSADGSGVQTEIDRVFFSESGEQLRIETSVGARVWDMRPERRSPAEVSAIVARQQPWRVIDGQLVQTLAPLEERVPTTIRGRATRLGKPVEGARVISSVFDRPTELATTAADGTFEFACAPGSYKVTVQSEELGAFGEAEIVAGEHPTSVEISLGFEASIAGRVVTRSGRPFPHAMLGASSDGDSGDAKTDAAGKFRIRALRGERTYALEAIDLRTGTPLPAVAPLPRVEVATGTTHVENIEILVEDDPVVAGDQIDPRVYYRLSTRWQPARSLDIRNEGPSSSTPHMVPTWAFTGQAWKLMPSGTMYQLSTHWLGDKKPLGLDGDLPRLITKGTQRWQLERMKDGAYRIRPANDPRCLAAGLRFAIVPCSDTLDQQWVLTPTAARVR